MRPSTAHRNDGVVDRAVAKLTELVAQLNEVVAEPSDALEIVQIVFDAVALVAVSNDSKAIFANLPTKALREDTVATFAQQALVVAERHPITRVLVIRTLARMVSVPHYGMDVQCLRSLSKLAQGEATVDLVVDAVDEMVVPLVLDMRMEDESCANIVIGLSHFDCIKLSVHLRRAMNQLCNFYKGEARRPGEDSDKGKALSKLIHCAVHDPENAMRFVKEQDDVFRLIVQSVLHDAHFRESKLCVNYLAWTGILTECVKHATTACTEIIKEEGVVRKLLLMIDDFWKREKDTEDLGLACCKKVGAVLTLMQLFLEQKGVWLEEDDLDSYVRLLRRAPTEDCADPIVLAAALSGLLAVIRKPSIIIKRSKQRAKHLKDIIQSLRLESDNNTIMPYIDRKMFKEMYKICERHVFYSEDDDEAAGGVAVSVPELHGATNPVAHEALASIVRFLSIFSIVDDAECRRVSEAFNKQGREMKLFKLLEVPSPKVKEAVLQCLDTVDGKDFDDEEVLSLVNLLKPDNIEDEEQLLGAVMGQLKNCMVSSDMFRAKHALNVLRRTFEVLFVNSQRNTYGNDQAEEQKLKLSLRCVELLSAASAKELESVRKHLRPQAVVGGFAKALKYEELYHGHRIADVCVELTWTGRHMPYLLQCLSGPDALDPTKKQGFRVLHRLADVMEGSLDEPMSLTDLSGDHMPRVTEACSKKEEHLWSARRLRAEFGRASSDEDCMLDRVEQQRHFVNFKGVERAVLFLEGPAQRAGLGAQVVHPVGIRKVRGVLQDSTVHKQAEMFVDEMMAPLVQREHNEDVFVPGVAGEAPFKEVFMRVGFEAGAEHFEDIKAFYAPHIPHILAVHQNVFTSDQGRVAPCYPLASLLRAIYAVLIVPADEHFREQVIMQLREVPLLIRLIGLLERCGNLVDCHIAAKLLRVMGMVIRTAPNQSSVASKEHIHGAYVIAQFATRCLRLLTPLLSSLGQGFELTMHQQTLAAEALRAWRHLLGVVTRVELPMGLPITRAECLDRAFQKLVSTAMLRAVFLCALYDMQLSFGSMHGQFITEQYARSVFSRRELHELVSDVLMVFLSFCGQMRYDIFTLFNKYSVLGKHRFNSSYVLDLMERIQVTHIQAALEPMIQERFGDRAEHIIDCAWVEMPQQPGGWSFSMRAMGKGPRMLVLTNKRVLFMARSRHGLLKEPCSACPSDSFCPVAPEIEFERSYKELTRIIAGPGWQLMILCWQGTNFAEARGEVFDFVISQRSRVRGALLETLSSLSGVNAETRVPVIRDEVVTEALRQRCVPSSPICGTFAMRVFGEGSERLSFFVLSYTHFFELEVKFEKWIPPLAQAVLYYEDDNEAAMERPPEELPLSARPRRENREKQQSEARHGLLEHEGQKSVTQPSTLWDGVDRAALEEVLESRRKAIQKTEENLLKKEEMQGVSCLGFRGGVSALTAAWTGKQRTAENSREELQTQSQKLIFSQFLKEPLSELKLVEFDKGDSPMLRLTFDTDRERDELVIIRFFGDNARERWRGALTLALHNMSASGGKWARGWDTDTLAVM